MDHGERMWNARSLGLRMSFHGAEEALTLVLAGERVPQDKRESFSKRKGLEEATKIFEAAHARMVFCHSGTVVRPPEKDDALSLDLLFQVIRKREFPLAVEDPTEFVHQLHLTGKSVLAGETPPPSQEQLETAQQVCLKLFEWLRAEYAGRNPIIGGRRYFNPFPGHV